jgi:hypothetical protein
LQQPIESSDNQILSFTIEQLVYARDPKFLNKDERIRQLENPELDKVFGSTVQYKTKSSKFDVNKKKYLQRILFQDFAILARDKDIPIMDAVNYAIEDGDVRIRCSCPSFLYHGWAYLGTQMDYLYGIPRENRPPVVRNPKYRSVGCKHIVQALLQLKKDKTDIMKEFAKYFHRLPDLPAEWAEEVEELLGTPSASTAKKEQEEREHQAEIEERKKKTIDLPDVNPDEEVEEEEDIWRYSSGRESG